MAGPFDDLIPQQPTQQQVPGRIYGAPDPSAGIDLQRDRVALERERDQLARDRERAAREQQEFTDQQRQLDASGGFDVAVEQGRAGSFFLRAQRANESYGSAGLDPDSLVGRFANDVVPNLTAQFSSDKRNAVRGIERDFIAAVLRYESGAAIPPEEFESARQIYFPSPNAGKLEVEAKRRARETAIQGLQIGAGPAAARAEQFAPVADEPLFPQEDDGVRDGDVTRTADGRLRVNIDVPASNTPPENPLARRFAVGVGDVVETVGDTLGLVGNPLNAGINAVAGTNLNTDLGQLFRDASGLPSPQNDAEQFSSMVNKGGLAALGLAGAARSVAPLASGAFEAGLSRFAAAPLTDTVAGATGGGSSDVARQMGAGPVGQTAAALVGGGASIPASNRIASLLSRPAPVENALVNAGRAEDVTVNRAMVDPSVQNRVTGVDATVVGGPTVRREMGKVGEQIQRGVRRLGTIEDNIGEPLEQNVAGQTVQRSAERFIKKSGQQARRLYDRAEKEAAGVKVTPTKSLQVVDETIAKLSETPETNAAEIAFLQKLRSDFQNDLSVGALRRVRTSLRKRISKGELTFGENESDVLSVMDAASDDIAGGLAAAGKQGAARMFKRADAEYRDRMAFIKNTVQKIVGKRDSNLSPARVFENFKTMASPKGDEAGLARMIREMEPEERADIAATFADALGKNNKGEFSTAHLLSQSEKLPRAARVNLFGADGAQSLDNLLRLAKEHARVMGGLNHSRTGVANDYRSWLLNVALGGGTGIGSIAAGSGGMTAAAVGAATAATGAGIKGGRDILTARALMSPDIAKWLASSPRTNNPQAINRHFDRLAAIAAREPALAADIQQIQQAILRAANENAAGATMRAAASDSSGTDRRE